MSGDHQKRDNLIANLLLHNIYKTEDGRHLYELTLEDLEQQFQDILSPAAQEKAGTEHQIEVINGLKRLGQFLFGAFIRDVVFKSKLFAEPL